jgi:hypothetical protein
MREEDETYDGNMWAAVLIIGRRRKPIPADQSINTHQTSHICDLLLACTMQILYFTWQKANHVTLSLQVVVNR